jgi:hypothetical protein
VTTSKTVPDLFEWQRARLEQLRNFNFKSARSKSVTVVVYHFWDEAVFDTRFDAVECAIYETWRHCGSLKTRIVVNRVTPHVEAFAEKYGRIVDLCVNPSLLPSDIPSMSVDCNANLHRYFDTDEVLVIQNDGFPLRFGLDEFEGLYDYVGAPFVRQTKFNRLMGLWPRFAVGNGGFSLRSKRICEMASFYWNKRYHWMPRKWWFVREDFFYCVLLPFLESKVRKTVSFAPLDAALRFSYDSLYGESLDVLPFGFHGNGAFKYLVECGLLDLNGIK